jgi:archaetidylinositol phosphate synthase
VLNRFRDRVSNWIRPFAEAISRTGISPNTLTFVGLVFGVLAAFLFAKGEQPLAGFTLLVAGFFDIIDGAVARVLKRETAFGGVLDSVADRYVDLIIFAGIIYAFMTIPPMIVEPNFTPGWGWAWGILAIVGSFMVSYVRARAEAAGTGKLDVGFAERAERMLILAVGALVSYTGYAVVLIAILTNLTVAQRLVVARRRLRKA